MAKDWNDKKVICDQAQSDCAGENCGHDKLHDLSVGVTLDDARKRVCSFCGPVFCGKARFTVKCQEGG